MPVSLHEEQLLSSKLFQKIRPICVNLTELTLTTNGEINKTGNRLQLLNVLSETLSDFFSAKGERASIALNLADYIFFPISQLLAKKTISDSELEHCLSIVDNLVIHCWIQPGHLNKKLFEQLVSLVSVLIGGAPNNVDIGSHSEEVIQNGVSCIKHLLIGSQNQASGFEAAFIQKKIFQSILAHTVSVLLECSLSCPKLEARLDSIKALNLIIDVFEDGESLAVILPGIMSVVAKLIKSKPHHLLVIDVLNLMSSIMSITFSDFDLGTEEVLPKSLDDIKNEEHERSLNTKEYKESIVGSSDNVFRTEKWLKDTLPHLKDAFKIILARDSNWLDRQVYREAVLHLDMTILRNCIVSCKYLVPMILESLSVLDAYDDSSKQYMESMSFGPNLPILVSSMKTLFENELKQLSFNLGSPDSLKVQTSISSLTFAVKTLIALKKFDSSSTRELLDHIHSAMSLILMERNSAHARKPSLVSTSQNGTSGEYQSELSIITSDYIGGFVSTDMDEKFPFAGIFDASAEQAIITLLKVTASAPQAVSTIDLLLLDDDMALKSINSVIRRGVLLWIEDIILQNRASDILTNSTSDVETYIDFSDSDDAPSLMDVQDNVYNLLETATNILEVNSNTIVPGIGWVSSSIVSLRAIGNSCTMLGEAFQNELIDVLFPVIECLASANEAVRTEAQHVTLSIAKSLYGGSVRNLIKSNSDYLLDSLSMHLTGESLNPRLPVILVVLIRIGGPEILNQLDDIITAMFTLLDLYYGYTSLCEGFFTVFSVCVDELEKEYFHNFDFLRIESDLQEDSSMYHDPWGMKTLDQVYNYVNAEDNFGNDDSDDDDDENSDINIEEINSDRLKNGFSGIESEPLDPKSEHPDIHDEGENWVSPLDSKTYNLLLDILEYAQRLAKHKSVRLTLITLKLINKIVPLISSQRSMFLPVAASTWDYVSSFLLDTSDARVITCSVAVLKSITRYANTFVSSRFIKLFKDIDAKNSYSKLLLRLKRYYIKRRLGKAEDTLVVNRTSTSVNWDEEVFTSVCDFYQYSLQKLGRFIPIDVATRIVSITVVYDSNEEDYGYFDDLVEYMKMRERVL